MRNLILSSVDEEFVPYEEALALKELGFQQDFTNDGIWYYVTLSSGKIESFCWTCAEDEPPKMFNPIIRPTFSQAFRWFREKYGLSGTVKETFVGDDRCGIICVKSEKGLKYLKSGESVTTKFFKEYEQAELECLKKLIEIVKK